MSVTLSEPAKCRDQVDRERRERWTAKRLEMIPYREFPRWSAKDLAGAQWDYRDKIQIKFWIR